MSPLLLQADPGDWLRTILDNLPLVIFLAAAILPSLAQNKRKQRKRAERESQSQGPMSSSSTPAQPGSSLEDRVRRYFEEMSQQSTKGASDSGASPSTPAPPPAVPRSPVAPQPAPQTPADAAGRTSLRERLAGRDADQRAARAAHASRTSAASQVTRRSRGGRGRPRRLGSLASASSPKKRARSSSLSDSLHGPQAMRRAMVLREILGPPRALEDDSQRPW